ncbi:MAG: DUF2066 domain-containing protein [Aestuariivirgaceae bacterium]
MIRPRWLQITLHGVAHWAAILLLCAAVWMLAGNPAKADPLFTVTGVKVDATDTDAAKAKLKAISQAQVKAFHILVERLGSEGDAAKVAHFKPSDIGRLMASLSVEEERSGPQRYIGKLTIKFLPQRVREALATINFELVEEQAPRIVVIPLWRTDQGTLIWDENPWRDAWQSLKAENSLVPVLIPLGDLTDTQSLTVEEALADNPQKLQALGYRYDAETVLVAIAEPVGDNSVRAVMQGETPLGEIAFDKTYVSTEGGIAAAARQAAARFHAVMIFKWKKVRKSNGLLNSDLQVVNLAVPFRSLSEWNALRGQLSVTPGVQAIDVSSLSSTGAQVRLTYSNGFENLRIAMQQQRLSLVLVGGTWVLQAY